MFDRKTLNETTRRGLELSIASKSLLFHALLVTKTVTSKTLNVNQSSLLRAKKNECVYSR